MARLKDVNWDLSDRACWERTHTALLMDIRDELKQMNRTLNVIQCPNFLDIPYLLRGIRKKIRVPKTEAK